MIIITIKDLIYLIPDMINLFLSGFIFMSLYNWLNNRKMDITLLTVWSLFINTLIKSFYSVIHYYLMQDVTFGEPLKILIFTFTGVLLAFLITFLKRIPIFQDIFYYANNKSLNDDIFDDIIDYKKKTMMKIYLKSSEIYYLGRFSFREEKGLESWLVLVDYYCLSKKDDQIVFDPDKGKLKSSVAITLKDVERIEIIYENDSETWERLNGKVK